MKKAISYIRISSKDQSNWSLEGQAKDIQAYCLRSNIQLIESFVDNGESAQSFDRASWKSLEDFVKKHFKEIDYLMVMAYDRFSRNVADALSMIERLEKKFNIVVLSITQPIPLHTESPYYFMFRTNMLVSAEMELRVIRDRAKTGIYRASKEGRFVRFAPIGYDNSRDERNKPILVINEQEAVYIKHIFNLYLQGSSYFDIEREMKSMGMAIRSNGRIQRILNNPIYAGFIQVSEYYGEPSHLVKGLHQPIISESTWWKTQALMHKPKKVQQPVSDELPLRGVLHCDKCGKLLTGAPSKGKYRHYYYYWCTEHRKDNFNADKVHQLFDKLVAELSIPETHINYLVESATKQLNESLNDHVMLAKSLKKEIADIDIKLDTLEHKYIFEGLSKESYQKWKIPLENERIIITEQLDNVSTKDKTTIELFQKNLYKLSNLHFYWNSCNTLSKQSFVKIVFEHKLFFTEGMFRTPKLPRLFSSKAALLKEKMLLQLDQHLEKNENNNISGDGEIRTRDTVSHIHTFQACSFNHSDTSP